MSPPWDPMPSHEWGEARDGLAELGAPWPEALMRHDMRWWAARVRCGVVRKMPSSRTLAKAWGCSPGKARRVMRDESGWMDPRFGMTNPEPGAAQSVTAGEPPARAQQRTIAEVLTTPGADRDQTERTTSDTRGIAQNNTEQNNHTVPGKPSTPALSSLKWVKGAPKHIKPHDLATTCLRVAAAITGRPCEALDIEGAGRDIAPKSAKTATGPILALLRALDWPDLSQFETEAMLLARAARECPEPIFARDIRGEGWEGGRDRRHSVSTLMVQTRWDERVQAAWAWQSGGAKPATDTATSAAGATTAWQHIHTMTSRGDLVERIKSGRLGPDADEHARRLAAIKAAGGYPAFRMLDQYTERKVREAFMAAYAGGAS